MGKEIKEGTYICLKEGTKEEKQEIKEEGRREGRYNTRWKINKAMKEGVNGMYVYVVYSQYVVCMYEGIQGKIYEGK